MKSAQAHSRKKVITNTASVSATSGGGGGGKVFVVVCYCFLWTRLPIHRQVNDLHIWGQADRATSHCDIVVASFACLVSFCCFALTTKTMTLLHRGRTDTVAQCAGVDNVNVAYT